jgi:hypothetical protein
MMNWTPKDFKKYCSSKAYHDDYAADCLTTPLKPSPRVGIYGNIRGKVEWYIFQCGITLV